MSTYLVNKSLFTPATADPPLYEFPPGTKDDLEYADLAIVDISKAATEEGKDELTDQVRRALRETGFFYVINHGYSAEQTRKMFSIANMAFEHVDEEEKIEYTGKSPEIYQGYKPRQTWLIKNGVRDKLEQYNINKKVYEQEHPRTLRPYLKHIDDFVHHNHMNVVHPILRILARGLDLPEETLVEQHQFNACGESSLRFMKYRQRTQDEEEKTNGVWLKGHQDFGSLTILWSQPVGGLQILSPDGKWRWIKHIENALVVNTGDGIDFLCGGYYPATRHRVVQPPNDQQNLDRLGVFYFTYANDDVELRPHLESPVLQRVGTKHLVQPGEDVPTVRQWREGRVGSYGKTVLKEGKDTGVEEEFICGVLVKHYN